MKVIAENRKARHIYTIVEKAEAGIELRGTEVKSLRNHAVNLDQSFARVKGGEMWIYDLHISPYEHGNLFNHDPRRPRRLLLHKRNSPLGVTSRGKRHVSFLCGCILTTEEKLK